MATSCVNFHFSQSLHPAEELGCYGDGTGSVQTNLKNLSISLSGVHQVRQVLHVQRR